MSLENPNEMSASEKREAADNLIKQNSLKMNSLFVKGLGKDLTEKDVPPGTYNKNQGVIICNIEGEIMAIPDNEKTSEWLNDAELRIDESIGVPSLNDAEYWGSEQERAQNSGVKDWLGVHQKFGN